MPVALMSARRRLSGFRTLPLRVLRRVGALLRPPAPAAPAPAPEPASRAFLSVDYSAEPTAGLIRIFVTASAPDSTPATLVVKAADGEALYSADIALAPQEQTRWLALHGHLLGDGVHAIRIELVDAEGALLAQADASVFAQNRGALAERVTETLKRQGAPVVIDQCGSELYDYADRHATPWFDREPEVAAAHIATLLQDGVIDAADAAALKQFVEQGFLVVEDLLGADELEALNLAIDDAVATRREGYEWGSSQRLHNLHEPYPAVRKLWLHPRVMRLLDLIFDAPARPCQSLTYVFGSQQDHHQDTIHLTPFPAGYMCGVWTALEDVQPSSGELMVYPGTHRLPRIYRQTVDLPPVVDGDWTGFGDKVVARWKQMLDEAAVTPQVYRPKAGTVLIWHENLMHAGSMREDLTRSRKSIVCHYFAEGVVGYYDSSATPGAMHLDARG